ncbi:hypothetical protein BsWGS_11086 [Bradybaena similaris]
MAEDFEDTVAREFFMDGDSDDENFLDFHPREVIEARQVVDERGDAGSLIVSDSDSDSSEDESESEEERGVAVSDAYSNEWLVEFTDLTGPHLDNDLSEGELFDLFINDDVIDLFVRETNHYAQQVKQEKGERAGQSSRVGLWRDVTVEEMSLHWCAAAYGTDKTIFLQLILDHRSLLRDARLPGNNFKRPIFEYSVFFLPCGQLQTKAQRSSGV